MKQLSKKVNGHLIKSPELRLESHQKINRFLLLQVTLKVVKSILKGDFRSYTSNMIRYSKSQSSNAKKLISAIRGLSRKTNASLGSIVRLMEISKEKMIRLNCFKRSTIIVFSKFLKQIKLYLSWCFCA